jgi:hypothetical protein
MAKETEQTCFVISPIGEDVDIGGHLTNLGFDLSMSPESGTNLGFDLSMVSQKRPA